MDGRSPPLAAPTISLWSCCAATAGPYTVHRGQQPDPAEAHVDSWQALLDVLILLLAALVLGALCERLKQNAILGYLLAGTLLGPNALDWMPSHRAVATIAELGVALLLFSIGLEFSWRRLRGVGPMALGGGTLQVLLTGAAAAGICMALGLGGRTAFSIGAMIALSSTACVVRLLVRRAEIDTIYGRHALGILLFQDIAVVPLVLIVTMLGREGTPAQVLWNGGRAIVSGGVLGVALYLMLKYILPLLIGVAEAARNRELPIILGMVTAVGAAWVAHRLGLSPVLGAFVAGLLLAESPYATQIRSDVAPLRTLFVTLFFSSIGMLADPVWVFHNGALVLAVAVAILLGKAAVASGVGCLFGSTLGHAVAMGICLAQVGEFSFVLAGVARAGGLIDADLFKLVISATIVTLFATPYLVNAAWPVARILARTMAPGDTPAKRGAELAAAPDEVLDGHVLIVGFGPAGRRVAETLIRHHKPALVVVELNSKTAAIGRGYGLRTCVGDATRVEMLEYLRVAQAAAVIVTIPDPAGSRQVIEGVRSIAPAVPVFARARYHVYRWELLLAGAEVVVDEEDEVGLRLARYAERKLRSDRKRGRPTGDAEQNRSGA